MSSLRIYRPRMVATRRSKVEDEEEKRSRLGWVGDETSDKVRFSEMTDGTTPLPVFWTEEDLKPFSLRNVWKWW